MPIGIAQQSELIPVELFLQAQISGGADAVIGTKSLQGIALRFYRLQSKIAKAVQGDDICVVVNSVLQMHAVLEIEREAIPEIVCFRSLLVFDAGERCLCQEDASGCKFA